MSPDDICVPTSGKRCQVNVVMFSILLLTMVTLTNAKVVEFCFCLQEIVKSLHNPVTLLQVGDGKNDFLIAEQRGVIRSIKSRDQDTVLLDITDRVLTSSASADERGLLGFVLHPKYSENGKLYIYYIGNSSNDQVTYISEFKAVENSADKTSEKILLTILQPSHRGNGGQLLFGHDGFLYIVTGDGVGDLNNTVDNAQDPTSLLGKVLRIDVDKGESRNGQTVPYAIPPTNPFVNNATWRPEIYAYGCRNMWRCSQDRKPDTNGDRRIFCGDPGSSSFEEIDIIKKGRNYGWNIKEGFECVNNEKCSSLENEEPPIYVVNHTSGGPHAIVGGYVYRGQVFADITGLYLYGDAMSGNIFTLRGEGSKWTSTSFSVCPQDRCPCDSRDAARDFLLAFGQDRAGELYILTTSSFSTFVPDGAAMKIIPPAGGESVTCSSTSVDDACVLSVYLTTFVFYFLLR